MTSMPKTAEGRNFPMYWMKSAFLILPEDEKRKKTREHRAEHAQADRDDLLWNSHISVPPGVMKKRNQPLSTPSGASAV